LAELLALAIFLLLQGQKFAKDYLYLAAKSTLKAYFPSYKVLPLPSSKQR
jgi:hypothetical protein